MHLTLGVLHKELMMKKLRSEKASIADLDKERKYSRIPRIIKQACFMTPVVKKTKKRATLEVERRFCGN